ncbi:metallophosphoesterase [Brevibacillus choshinensis]|uniref:metallophosphoesterase n=1 Tax=Brevibacillus choshinensis TaxID=54911 RepID=UPI002E1FA0AB|nr:metallophosphoesterase [Brevibacillus choshinensis]MED4584200.1 metallophosphoesterase [Brevibacillus choshinensis]
MIGIAILFLLCIVAVFQTLYVQTSSVHLTVPRMPPLTLIHITDLHGRTRYLNGSLHRLLNRWKPDIVCVTGDLVQNSGQLARLMEEIAKIEAKHGIYFVPGNYEREEIRGWQKRLYTTGEIAACKKQWESQMTVLENEESLIKIGEALIRVYGFDNSTYGNEQYDTHRKVEHVDWTVFLAHSPNIISLIHEKGIHADLLLTGHTHGGQVRLFGRTFGAYKDFHIGQKKDKLVGLFSISRGLGTAKIPMRLNCFPEITVFLINH